jgi:UDP-N-acetylglucosamine--N-acetylmuramyl-(pentapeptide) pyrophosphoryl-undecaprenol N-acetylglucosamine transferase
VLVAARRLGAATAIHEQNALPGRANRWLARRADLILTGLETPPGAFPPERTRLVGNPVRAELLAPLDRRAARLKLGLPLEGPVCLCFGGSLGAAAINRLMLSILRSSSTASSTPPWHFLWAAGPTHLESVRAELAAGPKLAAVATVVGYLNDMASAYAAADLVIARAGALTLAELAALGKPSILIPLPTSAGGHQLGNARCMAEAGATILVEESDPSAAEKIATSLAQLGADWGKLSAMGKAASGLGKPDAARAMAEALAALVIARS